MENDMAETVYGTHDDSHVMSERVQTLAASIYKEFEGMIKKYDEDVVKELMPLVVGILEGLDQSYQEKQENEVELELLRDDNEQLLTQYEREKQLRKASEQKYLEVEDAIEEERKDQQGKVESLESIVRMFELKAKNAQDHITRLDDKEAEMKKEYAKLHERYTELFKTHMDQMERTKLFMGADKMMEIGVSPRSRGGGFHLPNLRAAGGKELYGTPETPVKSGTSPPDLTIITSPRSRDSNASLRHELRGLEKAELEEKMGSKENKDNKNVETAEKGEGTVVEVSEMSTGNKEELTIVSEETEKTDDKTTTAISDTTSQTAISDTTSQETLTVTIDPAASSVETEVSSDAPPTVISDDVAKATTGFVGETELLEPADFQSQALSERLNQKYTVEMMTSPELEDDGNFRQAAKSSPVHIAGASKSGNESSLYDELVCEDDDVLGEVDDGVDITGMSKEVENLILENTELLATKNALNVVKDDLIAKVDELSSEQEILKEEISSLQTVKEKLKARVSELEDELKKMKETLEKEKQKAGAEGGEEDDIPMAQRKRFTRVEMARVLMERNQYKERLMELQEAVRWTEMIRASREHPELAHNKKQKGSIWNFFSNLFSSSNKPQSGKNKAQLPATVKYNAPTTSVRPVGDPNKRQRDKYNLGEKAKGYDYLQDDFMAEKARKDREKERREQYKQVRAHVKKDDGRMQAYGWSLPARFNPPTSTPKEGGGAKSQVPVPVPVYCRPLLEKELGMKLWCAAGVTLTGGKTRDGGSVVGASVFYSDPPENPKSEAKDDVEKLDRELQEHEKVVKDASGNGHSSLAWICTTAHNSSKVTVIDANNPADILETFHVTSSHILCIASVPGATESDYPTDDDITLSDGSEPTEARTDARPTKTESVSSGSSNSVAEVSADIGGITFVQCSTGLPGTPNNSPTDTPHPEAAVDGKASGEDEPEEPLAALAGTVEKATSSVYKLLEDSLSRFLPQYPDSDEEKSQSRLDLSDADSFTGDGTVDKRYDPLGATTMDNIKVTKATGSPADSEGSSPAHHAVAGSEKRLLSEPTSLVKDGTSVGSTDNAVMSEEEKASSILPTMWLGSQSGSLYVHSAVSQWKRCLHSVRLKDSVLCICHVNGRVFVGLADGSVAVFHRHSDGQWDLTNYHLIDLGKPHHSIRCMVVVANKHIWCGYRNQIHVLDPKTLKLEETFDAHPRKESQIRQMAWVGDGVWVSIRLDSTLRLYHAYTHQHLQDVDIEPYVSKMLGTGKLGFSFVRITSLLVSCNRLWIGTGNGVVISVPLSESNKQPMTGASAGRPGGVIRVYSDAKTDSVMPGTFIPYCSMSQAQLSFHGHRDAVKFFVAVPGAPSKGISGVAGSKKDAEQETKDGKSGDKKFDKTMLVLSGGEGYIDFRIGDTDEEQDTADDSKKSDLEKGDRSHLIVWHLTGKW